MCVCTIRPLGNDSVLFSVGPFYKRISFDIDYLESMWECSSEQNWWLQHAAAVCRRSFLWSTDSILSTTSMLSNIN